MIVEETDKEINKPTMNISDDDLSKEFNGKKQLHQFFKFKNEKEIPDEYEIRSKFIRVDGKKQRLYKLVKIE